MSKSLKRHSGTLKAILILFYMLNIVSSNIYIYEPRHEISNHVVCATSKSSAQPAHMHSLIQTFARRMNIL